MNKIKIALLIVSAVILAAFAVVEVFVNRQSVEAWTRRQLLEPADLAAELNDTGSQQL